MRWGHRCRVVCPLGARAAIRVRPRPPNSGPAAARRRRRRTGGGGGGPEAAAAARSGPEAAAAARRQEIAGKSYHREQSNVICHDEQAVFLPYRTFPSSSRHSSAVRSNDRFHARQSNGGNVSSVLASSSQGHTHILHDIDFLPICCLAPADLP